MNREEFNLWVGLLFFLGYFFFDVFYTKFILATVKLDAGKACVFSMILGTISFSAILGADINPFYGIPCIMGQGAGAYTIISFEKWKRSKGVEISHKK